jgi:hypothetical protein
MGTMHKELAAIVIFPLIITLFTSLPAQATNSEWNYQLIGTTGFSPLSADFYRNNLVLSTYSLTLDSKGYPHVVFRQPVNNRSDTDYLVMYACWDGTGWNKETIDHGGNAFTTYDYVSLALDTQDNPHVSYVSSEGLKYASKVGSYWHTEIVDPKGAPEGLSLALDSQGNPHIIYSTTEWQLRYASWTGSSWNIEVVSKTGGEPSLVLDSNDNPHICFVSDNLFYAIKANSTWNIQTVDEYIVLLPSLALDSNNNPHLSYIRQWNMKGEDNGLMYARWNGTEWNTQTVVKEPFAYAPICLALDSYDNPHIAYCYYHYYYFSWNGTGWNNQTIAGGGDFMGNICLVLDSKDNPHVFYITFTKGYPDYELGLMYAYADFNQSNPSNPPNIFPWTVAGIILAAGTIVAASVLVLFARRKNRKASTPL